jgi:ribonuclease T1
VPRLGRRTGQVVTAVVTVVLLLGVWWLGSPDGADDAPASRDDVGIPTVALSTLPREAAATVRLIDAGGPFPYPGKDGSTFGNFEHRLPDRPRGYYREYTVPTPGASTRGARRIIAGKDGRLYWTPDHYETFALIRR